MTKLFIPVAALYAAVLGVLINFFCSGIIPLIAFPVIVGAVAGELTGGFEDGSKAGVLAGIMASSAFIASAYSPVLMSPRYNGDIMAVSPGYALLVVIEFAIVGYVAGYLGGTIRDYLVPYT